MGRSKFKQPRRNLTPCLPARLCPQSTSNNNVKNSRINAVGPVDNTPSFRAKGSLPSSPTSIRRGFVVVVTLSRIHTPPQPRMRWTLVL
eukprot:710355-Amphidinium_carterae.2